ncbi:MAG: DUF1223 domain-containing protein [Alphaproteobacteria bacterium]
MRYAFALAALFLAHAGMAPDVAAGEAKSPVVVELFTSQGCSSCPPAEAYLRELADRPDIIALELHVDYWDYIGWKDPFAAHAFVERQRNYSGNLGERYVYTPQMVIGGRTHAVGSDRSQVEAAIRSVRDQMSPGPSLVLSRDGDKIQVQIGAIDSGDTFDVYFVTYDAKHVTKIQRGENRGMTLINRNIVRTFEHIGNWVGKPLDLTVSLAGKKGDGGCAVLVQEQDAGPILTAASLPFAPR